MKKIGLTVAFVLYALLLCGFPVAMIVYGTRSTMYPVSPDCEPPSISCEDKNIANLTLSFCLYVNCSKCLQIDEYGYECVTPIPNHSGFILLLTGIVLLFGMSLPNILAMYYLFWPPAPYKFENVNVIWAGLFVCGLIGLGYMRLSAGLEAEGSQLECRGDFEISCLNTSTSEYFCTRSNCSACFDLHSGLCTPKQTLGSGIFEIVVGCFLLCCCAGCPVFGVCTGLIAKLIQKVQEGRNAPLLVNVPLSHLSVEEKCTSK